MTHQNASARRLRALQRATTSRLHRLILRKTGRWLQFDPNRPSNFPLDIVTPIIPKDVPVFRVTCRLLRANLLHPLGTHYVIGPRDAAIIDACRDLDCVFIDENEVAPVSISRLREIYSDYPRDRSGWLFQQLLKLNADTVATSPNFLLIDADTAFVRPVRMEIGGRWIFDVTNGYEAAYDESIERLLGLRAPLPFSFVVHFMVFNAPVLHKMRTDIAERFGAPWAKAILKNLDFDNFLCFSEWNLYANFALRGVHLPHRIGYWFNREGRLDVESDVDAQIQDLSDGAKTVSFHYYKRKRSA
ncbi:MAG: hypothetical protein JJU00_02070 [Opitutales bacterium]|nr:hypothetical protein [Opitutales bacterium]